MIWIIVGFIISVLMNGVLIYTTGNLLRKNEKAEDFIVNTFMAARATLDHMRSLDASGAFESDDETGLAFTAMKDVVEDYANFVGVEVMDEEE